MLVVMVMVEVESGSEGDCDNMAGKDSAAGSGKKVEVEERKIRCLWWEKIWRERYGWKECGGTTRWVRFCRPADVELFRPTRGTFILATIPTDDSSCGHTKLSPILELVEVAQKSNSTSVLLMLKHCFLISEK